MYLSKLEIFGFKSFAQKTTLKFTDGISCVIGPNGSGKSNIVDAIRWVLGEQKTTQLRTDRMENLIFNGTNVRKPLGMTEVSLTVNNNKNVLKSEFTDVVISRRLYRSGESHYLINKIPCRLKDIIDLFMDTGMGANSYSVIELSMVESIISENPQERRHLFEEAAGVTKYKARRKSALRKLESTQQDMNRIADLIAEIQRTVNSLSRQVGKARRYLALKDELRQKDIDLAKHRYMHYMDDLRPLNTQLSEIRSIKEDTSHQITLEEALLEEYRREIMQIESTILEFNSKLQTQDDQIHKIKEDEAVAQTRIQAIIDSIARNDRDITEYQLKIEELKTLRQNDVEQKTSLERTLSENLEKYASSQNIKNEAESAIHDVQIQRDQLREQLSAISLDMDDIKEKRQQKIFFLESKNEQIAGFEEEQKQLKIQTGQFEHRLKSLSSDKNQLSGKLKELEDSLKQEQQEIQEFESDQVRHQILEQQIQAKLEATQSRQQFIRQIIDNFEGHYKGTQFIMSRRQQIQGIIGPLADQFKVNRDHQAAVETALGEFVHYIIVDTLENAINILDQVRKEGAGRLTMLCLNSVSALDVPKLTIPDDVDLLTKFVTCEPKYKDILDILLGDVILVDSLKEARRLLGRYREFRFITPSGELLDKSSLVIPGTPEGSSDGLLGRAERLKELEQLISDLNLELKNTQNRRSDLEKEISAKHKSVADLNEKKSVLVSQITHVSQKITESEIRVKSVSENQKIRESATKTILDQIQLARTELNTLEEKFTALSAEAQKIRDGFQESEAQYAELQKRHLSEIDAFQSVRIQRIQEENELKNIDAAILRHEQNTKDLRTLIEKREQETQALNEELAKIEEEKIKYRELKENIWEERDKIESQKDSIQNNYQGLRDNILNLENQIKKYRKQHDSSLERSKQLELQIHEINMKSENLLTHIREEYGENIDVGIGSDNLDVQDYEEQIQSLKFKINQLGQVNPLAVSEYEKENERLEFYTKQYGDLEEAAKSLQKTIHKINITARKQFLDTFTQIKENFERVFKSFFVNGEGTLSLDPETDPLESNIDILVRPKGRRVQTISLLSGGEKTLTAISLLFAIYLVKPSPFCILDEIDAPLDDVNISRFTTALKDFSKETQFIVVTHNKRTMEAADSMYGVTMEEEGLSKLVSVKFN